MSDAEVISELSAVPYQDTEGLKVGVASLINQWVRSQSDGSSGRPSACRAAVSKRKHDSRVFLHSHSNY